MEDQALQDWLNARATAATKIDPDEPDARAKLRDEVRREMARHSVEKPQITS